MSVCGVMVVGFVCYVCSIAMVVCSQCCAVAPGIKVCSMLCPEALAPWAVP